MSDILPVAGSELTFIQLIPALPVQYVCSYVTDRYFTDVDEVYNLRNRSNEEYIMVKNHQKQPTTIKIIIFTF